MATRTHTALQLDPAVLNHRSERLWRSIVAYAQCISLTACGSATQDAFDKGFGQFVDGLNQAVANARPTFISISNNANDFLILDGNNERFAIVSEGHELYSFASGRLLTGLSAESNGNVNFNGTKIAEILLNPDGNGRIFAYLFCSGPAQNYGPMTIAESTSGFTYSCAQEQIVEGTTKNLGFRK